MLPAFTLTLFLSALLLMLVQPMVGKLLLPWLGGTPSVWNTCMVFFQAMLLAGYTYAHLLTRRLSRPAQGQVHAVVLILALAPLLAWRFDPGWLAGQWPPPGASNPSGWLLAVLLLVVGLPFFAVSTTAPLLQRWFADTDHAAARDPYFLYAASNAGSLLGLLSYPFLVERWVGIQQQGIGWAVGYGMLAAAIVACGRLAQSRPALERIVEAEREPPPPLGRKLRWVLLAAVPSSVMLGVTTFITIDVAPVPLLWVLPLALYFLSFVLVFSFVGRPVGSIHVLQLLMLVLGAAAMTCVWLDYELVHALGQGDLWRIGIHLAGLFTIAMLCHGELARTRPAVSHLTTFYLLMSLGGVLGGMFNALVAPLAFDRIVEYPFALALAYFLLPRFTVLAAPRWLRTLDFTLALGLFLYAAGLGFAMLGKVYFDRDRAVAVARSYPERLQWHAEWFAQRMSAEQRDVMHRGRNFFGAYTVNRYRQDGNLYHFLMHGTTMHGIQRVEPSDRREEPLAYFHRHGPVGRLFTALQGPFEPRRIAVLGVGAGCLGAYVSDRAELTLYDIDIDMVRIARDSGYFTYLPDLAKRGSPPTIELGDGRLRIAQAPDGQFDLIVLDAFSSDAIPIHLLTREAFQIYRRKLAPGGRILVHISNRYLDLAPVLGNLTRAEALHGRVAYGEYNQPILEYACTWVVLALEAAALEPLDAQWKTRNEPYWQLLPSDPDVPVWTDDYSNLWSVLDWRRR